MNIDEQILDNLTAQAKDSPRLRMNLDLRNSPSDGSQRMLNAMEPGTVMPIHRHRTSSETLVIIRGTIQWVFYDDDGNETERVTLDAHGELRMLNVRKEDGIRLNAWKAGVCCLSARMGRTRRWGR